MTIPTKRTCLAGLSVLFALGLAGCAQQIPAAVSPEAPGFFLGFIQGLIAPIAFVISLFDHDVAIYAVPNDGGWYDFGFLLGILPWGGGSAAATR